MISFQNLTHVSSFLAYKTLTWKSNCYIIFPNLFRIIFFWWKICFINFQLYLKVWFLLFSCRLFLIYSWFDTTVTANWKHLSFLLMWFIVAFLLLSNQENLYMIRHKLDLIYDICNKINEDNWNQTHKLLFLSESKSFL